MIWCRDHHLLLFSFLDETVGRFNAMEDQSQKSDEDASAGAKINNLKPERRPASIAKLTERQKSQPRVKLPKLMKPRCFHVSPAPTSTTTTSTFSSRQINANKSRIVRRLSESMNTLGCVHLLLARQCMSVVKVVDLYDYVDEGTW